MSIITFPKILNDRLTDEGARALADMFNTVESSAQKITLEIAEERFEKRLAQVDAKIDRVEAHLETKITQSEARIIKWMFIFWVGQLGSMTAILFVFFKH